MKNKTRVPMSNLNRIILICLSVMAAGLLVLTIAERIGYRLTNTMLLTNGCGILIVLLLVWGVIALVMKVNNKALKILIGMAMSFLILIGSTVVSVYTMQYAMIMMPAKYATLVSPTGEKVFIMRQMDTGMESEEAAQASADRMEERKAYILSQPDAEPLEEGDEYPRGAFGYVYRAYPGWMNFFYLEKQVGDGEIYLGYESEAELRYEWGEDGSLKLWLDNAEVGDSGEILLAD